LLIFYVPKRATGKNGTRKAERGRINYFYIILLFYYIYNIYIIYIIAISSVKIKNHQNVLTSRPIVLFGGVRMKMVDPFA